MAEMDKLLQTIAAIHAAGPDESGWPVALGSLTNLLDGGAASLEVFEPPKRIPAEWVGYNVPKACELAYFEHYAALSPRPAHAFQNLHNPLIWDYQILDEATMDRDPFYSELLPLADLRYFLAGHFFHTKQKIVVLALQRTPRQGHVGKREISLMRQIMPHIEQAFDVATRLRSVAGAARSFEEALDWLADGAALVRADGKILFANDALRAIARRGDGIRIARGYFEFAVIETGARVAKAIVSASALRDGKASLNATCDIAVARASDAPPYLFSVRPLTRTAGESRAVDAARAIVFVRDPLRRHRSSIGVLREAFGLTPAEAGLARALQAGISVSEYARERALSMNTIYGHLRGIKEKTRTKRQAELVRKLTDLLLPLQE
jgi:DNA-binding CsgD family transcriptional regulator/PAS domain-containing protein